MVRTSFDSVPAVEANDRRDRALSKPCPQCGEPAGKACRSPSGSTQITHAARWDAWYAEHPA